MFTRKFDRKVHLALAVLLFSLVLGAAFGSFVLWPSRREAGYQPEQPVPFSHKVHAGDLQIECIYCHSGADRAAHATVPSVNTCMNCHKEVQTKNDDGQLKEGIRLLLEHWEQGRPIEWNRIHDLADFAYFDHSRHLAADLECQECHGQVEAMDVVWREFGQKMSWCLDCHKQEPTEDQLAADHPWDTRAPIHCTTCHR